MGMTPLLILSLCVVSSLGESCESFSEGSCEITEFTIISTEHDEPSAGACQDKCRTEETGSCKYFTHFEDQCYLLNSCGSVIHCPGCVSGPTDPDFDSCPWPPVPGSSTPPPPPTTQPPTTPIVTHTTRTFPPPPTTTAPKPTTTTRKPTTTIPAGCKRFYPGYLCQRHNNELDHITHINTPAECQAICQKRQSCKFFSHYIERMSGRTKVH